MKRINFFSFVPVVVIATATLVGRTAFAQSPGGSPGGVDTTLMKLFGKAPSFTSKSVAKILDKDNKETLSTPMTFSKGDDKIRVEVDLTQIKGASISPADLARMKQMGMDRVVSITRTDKKEMYLIYPTMKAYVILPLEKEEAEAAANPKLDAVAVGKETIEGHPCVKNKVSVKDGKGPAREILVWNATDLKDFPMQIRSTENNVTMVMRSSQVQLVTPDAKLFEPPAGFTKYESMQSLLVEKMAGGKNGK